MSVNISGIDIVFGLMIIGYFISEIFRYRAIGEVAKATAEAVRHESKREEEEP